MADRNAGRFIGTAIGPMLWGTTYVVFVGTLPTDHPILISALRALPAGLLMLLLVRRLPPLRILFPVTVLALTNIGLFFALLLISAARLPGGITATLAACQPLLVALLTWPLLGRRPGMDQIGLALLGMVGVGLLVLKGGLAFDLIGVLAGIGAALSMALGIVLMERWRNLAPPVQMTAWQLLIGGILILPFALLVEGLPVRWDMRNTLGLSYLVLFATALGYWLWVGGVQRLGSRVSALAFLSPVVALSLGIGVMEETLNAQQALGVVLVFLSIGLSVGKRA